MSMTNGTQPDQAVITNVRYHGLDLLRAVAMLLGLLVHAPLVYMIPELAWEFEFYAKVPPLDPIISAVNAWIHFWRMPTFFILAGFFAQLVLSRRGTAAFLRDRFVRIAGAMLFFMLVMNAISEEPWHLLSHYWFLYYLMIVSLLFVPLHLVYRPASGPAWATAVLDRPVLLVTSIGLLATPLTIGARSFGYEAHIPESLGDVAVVPVLYYLFWFVLGAVMFAHRRIIDVLAEGRTIMFVAVIAAVSLLFLFTAVEPLVKGAFDLGVPWLGQIIAALPSAICTSSWSLLLIGFAHRVLRVDHGLVRWLVQLSYPIYLLHLLPAIVVGGMLLHFQWPSLVAVGVNILITFVVCIVLYYGLIKFTPINWLVNGYRKSWLQWPTRQKSI